jgi:neutral ceramidase
MKETHNFYAGAAKVDITPTLGTIIGVDFLNHYARFIHDSLHVKTLIFKQKDLITAIIVVDICIMATDYMDDIKAKIEAEIDILPQNILLASNHNHASGSVIGLLGGAADMAYKNKLPALIVESVKLAKSKLKPAKIASDSINAPEFVVCRRYLMQEGFEAKNPVTRGLDKVKTNPFGGESQIIGRAAEPDPELCFLAIKDTDDNWIALLGNYSLHYAADWPDDSITADYFGEFALHLQQKLNANDDFIGIMSNGTSGDINIWDFMNPDRLPKEHYAKSKLIGETLAQRVVEKIPHLAWQNNPSMTIENADIELSIRKPSASELALATQSFIENDFDNLSLNKEMTQRIYDREQILLNEYPDRFSLPVQALKIGDLVIGALPGEFFAETGLSLKKSIKSKYFSICLANAYGGYIPPAHEIERGGYETWRARSSFMGVDAEAKIRAELLILIQKLIA